MRCPECGGVFVAGRTDANEKCPVDGTRLVIAPCPSTPVLDPFVGRVVDGRYRVEAVLGSGSMGTVYRAKQLNVGREVALKILRHDRSADEAAHARFKQEAELVARLSSPHTVTAFDSGRTPDGEPYLVMELLHGESLGQRLARHGRLEVAESLDTAIQVLRSLSEAHAKGIVHRDLKPDNVYFTQVAGAGGAREIVKVLDFGIAKLVGRSAATLEAVETQAGAVFGTPRYMSPEQAQGLPLDARSDLYTLGTILFQMLSGRPLFDDREAVVVMARHIKSAPARLRDLGLPVPIPGELDDLLSDVLAKDPSLRPSTADVFAERLLELYEALLSDSSGMRILRRSPTSSTNSASFAPLPLRATEAATVAVPAASPIRAGFRARARPVVVAAGFALAVGVVVALVALRLRANRGDRPVPSPPATLAAPVRPEVRAPVSAPPPEANAPPAPADARRIPERPAATPRSAGASASPTRGASGSARPPPPREPEAAPIKPSNGYGIFE